MLPAVLSAAGLGSLLVVSLQSGETKEDEKLCPPQKGKLSRRRIKTLPLQPRLLSTLI